MTRVLSLLTLLPLLSACSPAPSGGNSDSPPGSFIAAMGNEDGTLTVFKVGTSTGQSAPKKEGLTLYQPKPRVERELSAINWTPRAVIPTRSDCFASYRGNEGIVIWERAEAGYQQGRQLDHGIGLIAEAKFSPDARHIAASIIPGKGRGREILCAWEVSSGQRVLREEREGEDFTSFQWNPGGQSPVLGADLRTRDGTNRTLRFPLTAR